MRTAFLEGVNVPIEERVEYFLRPVRQEVAYLRGALSVIKKEVESLRGELAILKDGHAPQAQARKTTEEKPIRRRT